MTTEQETGRGAPVRRATLTTAPRTGPKTGPRTGTPRYGAPYQPKPRPRPDARPDLDGKRAAARPEPDTQARGDRAVRRPARRQRTPFVLLVVGLMSGGLVSLLLLNTMLAQDAITDATLREEIAVARQENEKLELEYQRKTQPDAIARDAELQGQRRDWGGVQGWNSAGDATSQVDPER